MFFNTNDVQGLMVSPQDGAHDTQQTISGNWSNWSSSILHNPNVLKISVSPYDYLYLTWESPVIQTCDINIAMLPVAMLDNGTIYKTSTTVYLYHNDQLIESNLVEGYDENQVTIIQSLSVQAGDTLQLIAEPNHTGLSLDWIQFTGGLSCIY